MDEIDQTNLESIVFSRQALEAGEDVLLADDPEYWEYSYRTGEHHEVVKRLVEAVLRASRKGC